ncbi:MAG: sugar ABC transporter permease [Lachnospiraceae bacterium]|nr:sugar ABC transporter permease [Lachnospiraceae bacterium]
MEKKSWKGYAYLAPAMIIMLVFTIYPLIKAVGMSFCKNYSMVYGTYDSIGLSNYQALFADKVFMKALRNTTIYVVFVVPLSIIISLIIAVLLNSKIKCQGLFQTIFFLPYVTSTIAIGIVWNWIFNSNYGLLNYILGLFGIEAIPWLNSTDYALTALIIFSIWKSLAFDILIFLAGLQTVSPDLYNAARVDATPRLRVFTKITVPGIMPMIVYAMIMGVINAFKVYNEVFALFKSSAGPANSAITVVYYIYDKFYNSANYGLAAAAAVVLFVIILVLTLVQRAISDKLSD